MTILLILIQIIVVLLGVSVARKFILRCFNLNEKVLDIAIILLSVAIIFVVAFQGYTKEKSIEALIDYSEVAKYNRVGLTGIAGSNITEQTKYSRMMEGFVWQEGSQIKLKPCDQDTLNKFEEIIKEFPKFPFGYYFKAGCLQRNGDLAWRFTAEKAVEILKLTTALSDHNSDQDTALLDLQEQLLGTAKTTLFH